MKLKELLIEKLQSTKMYETYVSLRKLYRNEKKAFHFGLALSLLFSAITSSIIMQKLFCGEVKLFRTTYYWVMHGKILFCFILFVLMVLYLKIYRLIIKDTQYDEERNYNGSKGGDYGTATFMTEDEKRETFEVSDIENIMGTIFGEDKKKKGELIGQKDIVGLNKNTLIIGGPSSGKSACLILTMIFQIMRRGESAIISDPKGELFKFLSELGKKLGYEVRILNLNPMNLDNSDACNIMGYVGDDVARATTFAHTIIENTTLVKDFWAEGAENALVAIILKINIGDDYLPEEKTIVTVYNYLMTHDVKKMEMEFNNLRPGHPALGPYKFFKNGKDDVKGQVLQGLGYKLAIFNNEKIQKIMGQALGSIDILSPGRKKCLYFVGSSDQDSSMEFVMALFYTLLYQELVAYADRRNPQVLPIPVHMVLDEYANLGCIPNFQMKLSTVRSRGIITTIVLQDINQLKAKHPMDTWKTVANDCDYFILLKTNDKDTMDFFSTLSGEETINVKNKKTEENLGNIFHFHANWGLMQGVGSRQLMTLHEIRTIKRNELLLVVGQANAIRLKKFFYKNHPYAKYIDEVLPAEHYPLWKLVEDGLVDKDFDYDHEKTIRMDLEKVENIEIDNNYDADLLLRGVRVKTKGVSQTAVRSKNKITDFFRKLLNMETGLEEDSKVKNNIAYYGKTLDGSHIDNTINKNIKNELQYEKESEVKNSLQIENISRAKQDENITASKEVPLSAILSKLQDVQNEPYCEKPNNKPQITLSIGELLEMESYEEEQQQNRVDADLNPEIESNKEKSKSKERQKIMSSLENTENETTNNEDERKDNIGLKEESNNDAEKEKPKKATKYKFVKSS